VNPEKGRLSVQQTVVIDYSPESAGRYGPGWAVVAIDVIRATTTAITAAARGWRCFPAPDMDTARELAGKFEDPLLAGESAGEIPVGFEMDNSPALLAARSDTHRPLVLVSSSGTKLIHAAAACDAMYLSCFRAYSRLADYLALRHTRVAIIGAGSKGEFREEDQACCAWVAAGLIRHGYLPLNARTGAVVARWRGLLPEACLRSRSVDFLKKTGRLHDLDFIFSRIDDLPGVFAVRNGEVLHIRDGANAWFHESRSPDDGLEPVAGGRYGPEHSHEL
jgi:2-phosphosulfolactate phosphatase